MEGNFARSVGPKADVAELEYVAALHQTSPTTRATATVSSLDILRFLKSRHSLEISHAQAKDIVIALGGGKVTREIRMNVAATVAGKFRTQTRQTETMTHRQRWQTLKRSIRNSREGNELPAPVPVDNDLLNTEGDQVGFPTKEHIDRTKTLMEEILSPKILYLDIVQLTGILLIPTLARMAKQWEAMPHPNLAWHIPSEKNVMDDSRSDENSSQDNPIGEIQDQDATTTSATGTVLNFLHTVWDWQKIEPAVPITTSQDIRTSHSITHDHGNIHQDESTTIPLETSIGEHNHGEQNEFSQQSFNGTFQEEPKISSPQDDSLSPQPQDLLQLVLSSMWVVIRADSNNDDLITKLGGPPLLTAQMIRALLIENGEMERANDPDLIQRMIEVAQSSDNPGRLDERAFVRALTADLQEWEVGCEDRETTYVYDIFGVSTLQSFDRLTNDSSHRLSRIRKRRQGKESSLPSGDTAEEIGNETKEINQSQPNSNSIHDDVKDSEAPEGASSSLVSPTNDINISVNGNNEEVGQETTSILADHVTLSNKSSVEILDTVVDSYASTTTLLLTWMTFIGQTGTYASLMLRIDALNVQCENETFQCTLGKTVVSWVVAALMLTLFGFIVLVPLSYGNHPTRRQPRRMLLATFLAVLLTVTPLLVLVSFNNKDSNEFSKPVEELITSQAFSGMIYLTTILGAVLAVNYFLHFAIGISRKYGYNPPSGSWIDVFATTSYVVGTARTKKAATRKVNTLLTNARAMHGLTESLGPTSQTFMSFHKSQSDTVFQKYTLSGERFEDAGSLFWVWERILTRELFDTEGIWLPARLIIFQFGQIAIALLTLFLLFFFVERVAKAADEAQLTLDDGLPAWFYDFVPTGQEVRFALIPAASISVGVCVVLIVLYIPSTVKTVLRYRCGQRSALGDRTFQLARKGPDAAYMNTANAIYGMLAAAVLFFFLIGLLLFLFVWDFSRPLVLLILAWGIGLAVTIGLKVIMTSFCRKRFFRAFYRIFPGRANLTTLALECWFIGLGGGVLIGRITQFLLASAFWIGRIDEPLLADNVALLGYKFDYVPLHYIKELLVHEAHRHPYLERLGAMYLMRLRHKSFASNDACGCWRQLFVLTLLPWLMKYRVFEEQRCVESLRDQESERQVQEDEDRELLTEMAGEIMGATVNFAGIVDQGAKEVGQIGLEAVDVGTQFLHR